MVNVSLEYRACNIDSNNNNNIRFNRAKTNRSTNTISYKQAKENASIFSLVLMHSNHLQRNVHSKTFL